MPDIALTEAPVIRAIEAKLDEADASKFTMYISTRAFVGSIPVDVVTIIPNLALNTHPTPDFWTVDVPPRIEQTYTEWGYSTP